MLWETQLYNFITICQPSVCGCLECYWSSLDSKFCSVPFFLLFYSPQLVLQMGWTHSPKYLFHQYSEVGTIMTSYSNAISPSLKAQGKGLPQEELTWVPEWRSTRAMPLNDCWPEAARSGTAVNLTEWLIAKQDLWSFIPQSLLCFLFNTQVNVKNGPRDYSWQGVNAFMLSSKG